MTKNTFLIARAASGLLIALLVSNVCAMQHEKRIHAELINKVQTERDSGASYDPLCKLVETLEREDRAGQMSGELTLLDRMVPHGQNKFPFLI